MNHLIYPAPRAGSIVMPVPFVTSNTYGNREPTPGQQNVLLQLQQIVEIMTADLQGYARKEKANQFYIDRQNKLIAELVTVHNSIEGLRMFHFWQSVEKEMERICLIDSQVCGYTISIRTRPTGDIFSLIQINSFIQ